MAIAITVFTSPGPSTVITQIASSSAGSASTMSITRMMAGDSQRSKKAASRPSSTPGSSDIATAARPMPSDTRPPCSNRLSMSRPSSSVPSKNRVLPPSAQAGGVSMKSRYCSMGSWGAISGANSDASAISANTTRAAKAPRLAVKPCQNSRSGPGGSNSMGDVVGLFIGVRSVDVERESDATFAQSQQRCGREFSAVIGLAHEPAAEEVDLKAVGYFAPHIQV
mmetsp:Transcript_59387/g.140254  ORF Transcript_59387/g.140254 Transcript_59387/m.140254 type:complete len:224 (-) Transcript_59387:1560-2231(-)